MTTQKKFNSFIFTHIPKCGGTSFRKYINDAALESKVSEEEIYIPGFNGLDNNKNVLQLKPDELDALKTKQLKIVANHAYYNVHKEYELNIGDPYYYTILREPISRFISHYNFFNFVGGNDGCLGVSLNDLDKSKLAVIAERLSNLETHYLANVKLKKMFELDNISKVAKYNLQFEFQCFGILERIAESLELLKGNAPSWLKFNGDFPTSNTNKISNDVNPEVLEIIAHYNEKDIELYELGLKLFDAKMAALKAAKENASQENGRVAERPASKVLFILSKREYPFDFIKLLL